MEQGLAVIMLNVLKSELGYKIKLTRRPDGGYGDSLRLDNEEGDSHEFSGPTRFEDALNWLRKKA